MSETRTAAADDVTELFAQAGVSARYAAAAVVHLGEHAAAQLREDPWRLLALPGIRPDQADHFARRVVGGEVGARDPRRAAALVTHLLTRAARDGHTVVPVRTVVSALMSFDAGDPVQAISAALDEGRVLTFDTEPDERSQPRELLALERYALAEDALADGLTRLMATATGPVAVPGDPAEHGVSVLSGGPGRDQVVAALARAGGERIAIAAPTRPAAAALAEIIGRPVSATYDLLEARAAADGITGVGGVGFARGEQRPLDAGLVVVDEASTLGVELAAALVEACADGTRLVLAGDPAALPPVAPGHVLADLIASGMVPVTEVGPPAGAGPIDALATAVREGRLPPVDSADRQVVVVPAGDGREAAHRVTQLVTDSIPRALGIVAADVQVVTAAQRGEAGTTSLNRALKARLNPGPGRQGGFDPGDRVVATVDLHCAAAGETGEVTGCGGDAVEVSFPAGMASLPPDLLRHGWAMTVHRAQGARWPAVVAVLPGEVAGTLSRPLVVTALTRARRHLSVVHAAGPALVGAVRRVTAPPRRTRLAALLSSSAVT